MHLIIFLFHVFFKDQKEIDAHCMDPQGGMLLTHFRQFIEYLLANDYSFVTPDQIGQGLNPSKKYVLATFDDGYCNNYSVLPLLKEYQIPALFFISPNFVKQNKSFWWDVLYRKRHKQGLSIKNIYREGKKLKTKTHGQIERYLIERFGAKSLNPIGDMDRPLTERELQNFAKEKHVFIGNHTLDHAILTNYPEAEIRYQIVTAQQELFAITGIRPASFSYPNGSYSPSIIRTLKETGFALGITCRFGKNRLPIDFKGESSLKLNRFGFVSGDNLPRQCGQFLSGFSPVVFFQNLRNSLAPATRFFRKAFG